MITLLILTPVAILAAVLFVRFLLRRDRQTSDMDAVSRRVDSAMYFKSMPDPCADGHESLIHEFGQRVDPTRSGPNGPSHGGAPVIVYEGSFCATCTAPAPTPPWRDCTKCHAHITAGGLGLEFELEPCKKHARNAGWDGWRWSV